MLTRDVTNGYRTLSPLTAAPRFLPVRWRCGGIQESSDTVADCRRLKCKMVWYLLNGISWLETETSVETDWGLLHGDRNWLSGWLAGWLTELYFSRLKNLRRPVGEPAAMTYYKFEHMIIARTITTAITTTATTTTTSAAIKITLFIAGLNSACSSSRRPKQTAGREKNLQLGVEPYFSSIAIDFITAQGKRVCSLYFPLGDLSASWRQKVIFLFLCLLVHNLFFLFFLFLWWACDDPVGVWGMVVVE